MSNNEIKHIRLYEQVILKLRNDFLDGQLKIGDRLDSERVSAERFNISRGTLRDAFRVLESQGIIESIPGDGRYLRKSLEPIDNNAHPVIEDLKKAAMFDLIETREILEVGMIDYVCKRATAEDIQKLESLVLISAKDLELNSERDVDYYFHHALAECSKNSVILNFMKLNMEIINDTREKNFSRDNNFEHAQQEHFEIVEAIKARNPILAKEKVREHFKHIRERMEG